VSRPVPTWRLAALAVLGAVLILVLPDLGSVHLGPIALDAQFVLVDLALVSAAVADWALAPHPGRIEVARHLPASVVLGHPASVRWEVANPTTRRTRAWLADELAPSLGAPDRRVGAPVPAGGRIGFEVGLQPTRRGRFELGEVVVRTAGPLGLVLRQQRRSVPGSLRVLPPFRSAREAELRLHKARILDVGLRSAKGRGSGTEFDSLRELTPDDETRRIDWAATARTGRPIVRTYRSERNQTVLCLLDAGRTMAGRVEGVPRLEHAMDAMLLLAELATGLGDKVGLVAFDQDVRHSVDPSASRTQRARLTDTVFDLQPGLSESDYRSAFTHTVSRFRRRSLLVLLTELVEQSAEQFLVPVLPLLARSHVVVVAAVVDPEVQRWASDPVTGDDDAVWRRAAAIAALEERRRLAGRLRGLGATVIDDVPGRLAPRLGDAYLEIKAVGRL
jgi:uncharacterized protein (DUF58 family)